MNGSALTWDWMDRGGYFSGRPSRKYKDRAGKTRLHKKLIATLILAGKRIWKITQELRLSISLVKSCRTEMNKAKGFTFWADASVCRIYKRIERKQTVVKGYDSLFCLVTGGKRLKL